MAAKEKLIKKIIEILKKENTGIYYAELVRSLEKEFPDTPIGTIHGAVAEVRKKIHNGEEKDILNPERGFYIMATYHNNQQGIQTQENNESKIKEKDFYKSFAEYLVNDLQECTQVTTMEGRTNNYKWGNPDVVGIYKFSEIELVKPPIEIITAEIKTIPSDLVTAFGQACAYKLFSHKVYIAAPNNAREDLARLEALCLQFGIGLIIFDPTNVEYPNYQIRARAVKTQPDYYYINQYIRSIAEEKLKLLLG